MRFKNQAEVYETNNNFVGMKRLVLNTLLFSALLLGLTFCGGKTAATEIENNGTADNPKPEKSGPKGTPLFEDTVWDFKRVSEGEEVKHSYVFTNTGKGELQIKTAQASCGCTSPNWTKDPIPPGGKGFVDAKFNSSDRGSVEGMPNEKMITVTFENSTQEQVVLKFKATVFSKKDKSADANHNNH